MTTGVFLAVISAALMHASWNLLVKLKLDRFLSLFLIQSFMGVMGIVMILAFPHPQPACLPFALASGLLHLGYNVFLSRSYRTGELSQIYPIARGGAPLVTLLVTGLVLREPIGLATVIGILLLVSGIWTTSMTGSGATRRDSLSVVFALVTSVFIAAYSVVDGLGGRASGEPSAYTGIVFVFDTLFFTFYALATRGTGIYATIAPWWRSGLAGAALSAGAYWIVIWAMTQAQIASVAALRETSILFVILLSGRFLNETITLRRLAGAGLIVAGAIVLRLA